MVVALCIALLFIGIIAGYAAGHESGNKEYKKSIPPSPSIDACRLYLPTENICDYLLRFEYECSLTVGLPKKQNIDVYILSKGEWVNLISTDYKD